MDDTPAPVERTLERMTRRLPENRPRSALEVIESLEGFLPSLRTTLSETDTPTLLSSSLVGRKKELQHLIGLLKVGSTSRNAAALITGPAGIGKSRLLKELRRRAQLEGATVLAYACARADRRPLGPFTEVLSKEPGATGQESEWMSEDAPPDPGQLVMHFEKVAGHFARIGTDSGAPLLVLVDNLELAKPAIQSLLEYLTRFCSAEKGLVCVATADRNPWKEMNDREFQLEVVRLKSLTLTQTKTLMSNALGLKVAPDLARWVHSYSGGVPLLVEETLRWLHRDAAAAAGDRFEVDLRNVRQRTPPRSVAAITEMMLRGLSNDELDILGKAAVIGDAFDKEVLARVSGYPDQTVDGLLKALGNEDLIQREAGGKYSFTHAWLADSLHAGMGSKERRSFHRRIMRVLESIQPSEFFNLAGHAAGAGLKTKTSRYALAAAREARKTGSFEASVDSYRLALSNTPQSNPRHARIAEELADSQVWLGYHDAATAIYARIHDKVRSSETRTRLLRKRAACHHFKGDYKTSDRLLERARLLTEGRRSAERARILLLMGWNAISTDHLDNARRLLDQALRGAPRLDDQSLLSRILRAQGTLELRLGNADAARELAQRAMAAASAGGVGYLTSSAQVLLAQAEQQSGHLREARDILEKALDLNREISYLGGQGSVLAVLALLEQELGELEQAREHYEDALITFLKIQSEEQVALTENNLGYFLDTIGDWAGAKMRYSSAIKRFEKIGAVTWRSACLINLGRLQILAGESEEGTSSISEGLRTGRSAGFWPSAVEAYETLSIDLMNRGDLEAALRQTDSGKRLAREKGVSPAEPMLQAADIHLLSGDLAAATREFEELSKIEPSDHLITGRILRLKALLFPGAAKESIKQSTAIFERLNDRFELARNHLARADLHATGSLPAADGGDLHAAVRAAEDALDIFRSLGATPYAVNATQKIADYKKMARDEVRAENVYLETIFAVNKMMDLLTDQESMLDQILDRIIDILGAERGMLLLMDEAGGLFPAAGRKMDKKSERDVTQISRSVVRNVTVTGRPILSGNASGDPGYMSMPSIMLHGIKSLMCVPLLNRGEPVGALYVDSTLIRDLFTRYDDEFLMTVGNLLASSIDKSRYIRSLETQNVEMKKLLRESYSTRNIIGSSARMTEVVRLVSRYAVTDRNVLITGERGTGKGLVARALHFESPRRSGPFVVVDATHIPDPLIEDALFGHTRGAFSGAYSDSTGLIESAAGGTVFLDNIDSISLDVQAKLTRPLQFKEVRRLGSTRSRRIDFRIVSATSVPLQHLLERKAMRLDLQLVLRVLEIELPPLRERGIDILELAKHFLDEFTSDSGKRILGFSREAADRLTLYSWPGNVTELRRCIERAVALSGGGLIAARDIGLAAQDRREESPALSSSRDAAELSRLRSALAKTQGNVTIAARALSVSRRQLQRLLRKHGLTSEEFRRW